MDSTSISSTLIFDLMAYKFDFLSHVSWWKKREVRRLLEETPFLGGSYRMSCIFIESKTNQIINRWLWSFLAWAESKFLVTLIVPGKSAGRSQVSTVLTCERTAYASGFLTIGEHEYQALCLSKCFWPAVAPMCPGDIPECKSLAGTTWRIADLPSAAVESTRRLSESHAIWKFQPKRRGISRHPALSLLAMYLRDRQHYPPQIRPSNRVNYEKSRAWKILRVHVDLSSSVVFWEGQGYE